MFHVKESKLSIKMTFEALARAAIASGWWGEWSTKSRVAMVVVYVNRRVCGRIGTEMDWSGKRR